MALVHLTIEIARRAQDVYDYVVDPANLPEWASGLGRSVQLVDGRWVAEAPFGWVVVAFVERNAFGVLDHDVTMPTGEVYRNPMRVLPEAEGCEVMFSLRRPPGTDEEEHERDVATVRGDLAVLRQVMERP